MSSLPFGILALPIWQAVDDNGDVLPNAQLFSYTPNGAFSTPKALYDAAQSGVALSNPVVADAAGRFVGMFLQDGGYDLILKDENDVEVWRVEGVESIGQTFLNELGTQMASGTFDVSSGYTVVDGDWFITTDAVATNPFIMNLPDLATWTAPITIKHQGSGTLRITPAGTDAIEAVSAYYAVAAAASPNLPTVTLVPGSASWWIQSSHGL